MDASDLTESIYTSTPIDEGLTGIDIFETTRSKVEKQVNDTLAFYKTDPRFKVTVSFAGYDGHRVVAIAYNLSEDVGDPCWERNQVIEYDDEGKIIYVRGDSYNYYSDNGDHIVMGTSYTDYGNGQNHDINCVIATNPKNGAVGASLTELTRVKIHTDLQAIYTMNNRGGVLGFELDHIDLERYLRLSKDDMRKFISGRFRPLDDVIAMAVDPWRISGPCVDCRQKRRISEIDHDPAFIPLGLDKYGHAGRFVSGLNQDGERIYGFAHPLKDDPDGWLVFTGLSKPDSEGGFYSPDSTHIGRALIIRVDRDTIHVEDREGTPTIFVNVTVDNKVCPLSIPRKVGSNRLVHADTPEDEEGVFVSEDGKKYKWVYLTAEELFAAIQNHGHYIKDMLNAALEQVYRETFDNDEV